MAGTGTPQSALPWYEREDTWAIIIALSLVLAITVAFFAGGVGFFKSMAVSVPSWSNDFSKVLAGFGKNPLGIAYLFAFFLVAFGVAAKVMKLNVGQYINGFVVLFIFSVVVTILGSNEFMKTWQLETPLLALLLGMLISNTFTLPKWFQSALKTEFYVKTGIVLMGATLPFTIIMQAGPMAILQATKIGRAHV